MYKLLQHFWTIAVLLLDLFENAMLKGEIIEGLFHKKAANRCT